MWQDQTLRMPTEAEVDIAPTGDIHLTWKENGTTFTLILPLDEFDRIVAKSQQKRAEVVPA